MLMLAFDEVPAIAFLFSVSVLFLMIECGVFGGKYSEYFEQREPGIWYDVGELSWAFALGVTATVLTFISLCLLVVDLVTSADMD